MCIRDSPWAVGDKVSMRIGDKTASYSVSASDISSGNTVSDLVAIGMKNAIEAAGISGLTVNYDSSAPGKLSFANAGPTDLAVSGQFKNANSGGLGALATIDVTTGPNAKLALGSIESMVQTSLDAASEFGSTQKRIDIPVSYTHLDVYKRQNLSHSGDDHADFHSPGPTDAPRRRFDEASQDT